MIIITMLQGAYQGTIHIVEQAIVAGVKKIVVTGTSASLFDGKSSIHPFLSYWFQ